ncbi:MAG: VOC family protein [Chloroflexi bacterium]|nr:MAG: VOC family protein [Chloroflexota bacterium]
MPFPVDGVELTHLLVVADIERSRAFYRGVLGATVFREYGGTSWDKPGVTFAPPADPDVVSHELTIRVPDCHDAYNTLVDRGAVFLTPPVEYEWEVRCFFRDPDGHLLEISEARSRQT